MRRVINRLKKEEEGSVAVIFAAVLIGLIGLAALGTDVGMIAVEQQRLSNIADAAALSGAQFLPQERSEAEVAAREYLQKNGVDLSRAEVAVGADGRTLQVRAAKTVDLSFAKVIGFDTSTVSGAAKARTDNLSGYFGAAPLGVPQGDYHVGEMVYLKVGSGTEDTGTGPGNYQALALGKNGASTYEQNLMTGYQNWLRVDQWVTTETGNMAGPTARAVLYRISQDSSASFETVSRSSPRLVIVPIIDSFNINGRGEVKVMGFGMFYLEGATDNGNNKGEVRGRFLRFVAEGEANGQAPDFGVYKTKLID